ncbi:hypothetical protein PG987_006489 [Apiospora arundinis]
MNVLDLISFLRVRPTLSAPLPDITGDGPKEMQDPPAGIPAWQLGTPDPDRLVPAKCTKMHQNASQRQMSKKVKQCQEQSSTSQATAKASFAQEKLSGCAGFGIPRRSSKHPVPHLTNR